MKRAPLPARELAADYERPPWAVVISAPGGLDNYFGHFFQDEAAARALIAASKAGRHGYRASLYHRVDEPPS